MLAKSWKKILLVILIIACLWNIIVKITYIVSFKDVTTNLKEKMNQEQKVTNEV